MPAAGRQEGMVGQEGRKKGHGHESQMIHRPSMPCRFER